MTKGEKKEERVRTEGKYEALVETAADAIFTLDLLGRFTFLNPAAERISGYSEEELVGKHFRELLSAKHIPACLNAFQKALRGQPTSPIEIEMITKEGERVPLELLGRPVKRGRRVVEVIGIARDITKRKQAEEALRKSEERYRKQFEEALDAIFIADAETGILVDCNRVALELVGREKSELVGKHQRILHPPEEIEGELSRTFRQHLKEKEGQVLETQVITKKGEIKDVAIKASIFELEGKKVLLGIFRDITERKRAEDALRESEEKYRTILENIEDGYFEVDIAGNFTFFNDALCRIFGYPEDELMGMNNRQYMDDETAKAVYQTFNAVYRTGKPAKMFDYEIIRKDGTRRSVEASVSLISGSTGEPVGFRGIVRDITERKRAEEKIRQRSEELAALYDVSLDVAAQLDLDTLLKTMLLRAMELLRATAGGFYLYDPERQELELVVAQGLSKDYTGTRLALGEGACGKVAQSGEPLTITDYTNWEGRSPHFDEEPTFNVLAVPIKRGDTLLGAFYVDDPDVERRFEEGDIHLATLFANQAAIAIQNAQLFEESQRRREEMAALRQVSLATLSTLEREQVFEIMLDQLGTVIDYDTAAIKIITPDGRDKMIAGRGPVIYDQAMWDGFDMKDNKLVHEMKETRQTVVVHDTHTDERYERVGNWEAFRSWVGAPLFVKEDFMGYLALEKTSPGSYDENAVRLLGDFARAAAIALENAKLYEETQKRLAETTVLHRVAEVINSTLHLKEIFQRVVEELSETFGYRLVGIYLLEEDGLRLQANVGYDAQTTIELIPLERGIVGRVARTEQPAFIRDVTKEPDYIPAYPEIKSEICVPIVCGEKLLGTLNVECDEKRPLTEDDLQLLVTLSSHIGVAMENARLYEEEHRRSLERKTIAEVGHTIAAILDLDTLLSRVVDLIAQNFGYYFVHVFEVDADAGYAVFKAGTGEAGRLSKEEESRLKIGEEGIIGWVAQSGHPLMANDVNKEPRFHFHPPLPDTRSELAVPVHLGEKIIGVLDVQSEQLNAFDESDLATLETLAHQLAVAMENARLYEETQRLAITDGLTGLYNLRYFYEALEKEIQRSERYHRSVSLIMLDIDDFKAYNDLYGHLAGDDLLIELAQLMSKVTRRTDTLARYGGEEFAIILPETETEGARFLAQRLQEEVREYRFQVQDDQTIGQITISLGVATYPHHADSTKALVDAADRGLLRAKRAGKNRLSVCGEN